MPPVTNPTRDRDGNEIIRVGLEPVLDQVGDVTRGITDTPLIHEAKGFCAKATNLIFNNSSRLRPHPGWELLNKQGGVFSAPLSEENVDHLFTIDQRVLLAISLGHVLQYDEATDTFNLLFEDLVEPLFEEWGVYTSVEINKEVIVSAGKFEEPIVRFYLDENCEVQYDHLAIPKPNIVSTGAKVADQARVKLYRFFYEKTRQVCDPSDPAGRTVKEFGPYIQVEAKSALLSSLTVLESGIYPGSNFNPDGRFAEQRNVAQKERYEDFVNDVTPRFDDQFFLTDVIAYLNSLGVTENLRYLGGEPWAAPEEMSSDFFVQHESLQEGAGGVAVPNMQLLEGATLHTRNRKVLVSYLRNILVKAIPLPTNRDAAGLIGGRIFSLDPDLKAVLESYNIFVGVGDTVTMMQVNPNEENLTYSTGWNVMRFNRDTPPTVGTPNGVEDTGSFLFLSGEYLPFEWGDDTLKNGIIHAGTLSVKNRSSVLVEVAPAMGTAPAVTRDANYVTYNFSFSHTATGDDVKTIGIGQKIVVSDRASTSLMEGKVGYITGVYIAPEHAAWDGDLRLKETERSQVAQVRGAIRVTEDKEGRRPLDMSQFNRGFLTISIAEELSLDFTLTGSALADYTLRSFRTKEGATEYFEIPESKIDTSGGTINDTSTDDDIESGASFPDVTSDETPNGIFVSGVKGRLYIGQAGDTEGALVPYRVRYSKETHINQFPSAQHRDLPFDVRALQRYNNNMYAFTDTSVHRLEESARNIISEYAIENISGGVSPHCAVATSKGLFFASQDGVYFTEGAFPRLISEHLHDKWLAIPNKDEMLSFYDPVRERAYFWFRRLLNSPGGFDGALVLDVRQFDRRMQYGVFSEIDEFLGPFEHSPAFAMTAMVYHQNKVWRSNLDHRMARYTSGIAEREVYLSGSPRKVPVLPDFLSAGLHFGRPGGQKVASRLSMVVDMRLGSLRFFVIPDGGPEKITGDSIVAKTNQLGGTQDSIAVGNFLRNDLITAQRSVVKGSHSFYQIGLEAAPLVEHEVLVTLPDTSMLAPGFSGSLPIVISLEGREEFRPFHGDNSHPFTSYLFTFDSSFPEIGNALNKVEFTVVRDSMTSDFLVNRREVTLYISGPFYRLGEDVTIPENGVVGKGKLSLLRPTDFDILNLTLHGQFTGQTRTPGA